MKPTEDKVMRQALIYQAVKFTNWEGAQLLVDDFLESMELGGYEKKAGVTEVYPKRFKRFVPLTKQGETT